jgi:shikimate 5-dehydrogenase
MAVFQAAEALQLFTGQKPDTERMLEQFQRAVEAERLAD